MLRHIRHALEFPARHAGMKVPPNLDHYEREVYPHWHVYCEMQLPYPESKARFHNAEVIASIGSAKIRWISEKEIVARGFESGNKR